MGMKLLLRNHMLLGDTLMMTSGVRDLKATYKDCEIIVDTNHKEIWENNPHISHSKKDKTYYDSVYDVGPRIVTQGSKLNGMHFTTAFRVCFEDRMNKFITQGLLKPELFLTEAEKNKKIIDGKYWLVNTDYGGFGTKEWFNDRWQEVIDTIPWITFVQIGLKATNKFRLRGKNVIDLVGKTEPPESGLRDLFSLFFNAQGVLSLVSASMHIAAAFDKPCVVIAGNREPVSYIAYQGHTYLHNIGTLPCSKVTSCWACAKHACFKRWFHVQPPDVKKKILGEDLFYTYSHKDSAIRNTFDINKYAEEEKKNWIPQCIDMIRATDVVSAVLRYYEGGRLSQPSNIAVVKKEKVLRIISNGTTLGGAERSYLEIIQMAQKKGYMVELATRRGALCSDIKNRLMGVRLTHKITAPCDVLLLYASDMIWDFHKAEFERFEYLQAKKKIMALTYKIGRAGSTQWTKGWDKYLFLSSTLKDKFLERVPEANTKVLAPPIDVTKFLDNNPDFEAPLHILRHSSQGDNKYSKDVNNLIKGCNGTKFSFMPAPSFLESKENVTDYNYNEVSVPEFLSKGNCFWYMLPYGYTDQGPRVIMEAMAAGLPVIAENRDGAKDRVTEETGWLIDKHEEAVQIINELTPEVLERKGKKAKERAMKEFRKENWIEEIIGG